MFDTWKLGTLAAAAAIGAAIAWSVSKPSEGDELHRLEALIAHAREHGPDKIRPLYRVLIEGGLDARGGMKNMDAVGWILHPGERFSAKAEFTVTAGGIVAVVQDVDSMLESIFEVTVPAKVRGKFGYYVIPAAQGLEFTIHFRV